MNEAVAAGDPILVPAISLVEIVYLVEKGQIPRERWTALLQELERQGSSYKVVPLTVAIARSTELVPRRDVPDMPDRIIAATALQLGLPLVSRDGKLLGKDGKSKVPGLDVVW